MADANVLIARLGVDRVDWVGTSMGGLIGIMLAALPNSADPPLVINDIGPFVPKAALERIGSYMVKDNRFADMAAFEAYLRDVYAPFGPLSDEQWQPWRSTARDRTTTARSVRSTIRRSPTPFARARSPTSTCGRSGMRSPVPPW